MIAARSSRRRVDGRLAGDARLELLLLLLLLLVWGGD